MLFEKLHDGCQENMDHINLFTARQQSELAFGNSLASLPGKFAPAAGKSVALNSSTKNAFIGINGQLGKEGEYHLEIAKNIDNHVILPFTNWAIKHKQRVEFSENELKGKIKSHEKLSNTVDKSRIKYFNKVRSAEEFKEKLDKKITETIKRANTDPASSDEVIDIKATTSLKRSNTTIVDDMQNLSVEAKRTPEKEEETEEYITVLGGDEYTDSQLKDILLTLLREVPKFSHKVPIFGTYERVSTGFSIVEAIQKNLGISKLDKAEQFGQDLISNGYLRLIGTVGNQFANSSKLNYQWRPEAYKAAEIPVEGESGQLSSASTFYSPVNELNAGLKFSEVFEDVRGMITTLEPNEENYKKILKDVKRFEQEYFDNAKLLDAFRLELEESIEEHLNFMQRCELDRLRALKKVTLDFLSILANKFSSLKSIVDKSMVFQENMKPEDDLLHMIETHKTGSFIPHLKIFEDYFDSQDTQVFGVGLQSRCRFDHKSVPLIISSILIYLDGAYPNMSNDDERINVWLKDVPLIQVHELRNLLNDPKLKITNDILGKYQPEVLASVLRLYLLELPNSLVPNEKYYLIKSLYEQYGNDETLKERVVGLENLLVDLPRPNIATLSYLCAHLSNFISIIALNDDKEKKDSTLTKSEFFKVRVCQKFATAILRPKAQYAISLSDQHSYRLIFDLLTHKDEIFKELKKRNTTVKKSSVSRNTSKKSAAAAAVENASGGATTTHRESSLKNVSPAPLVLSVDNKNLKAENDKNKAAEGDDEEERKEDKSETEALTSSDAKSSETKKEKESEEKESDGNSLSRKKSRDEEPDTIIQF